MPLALLLWTGYPPRKLLDYSKNVWPSPYIYSLKSENYFCKVELTQRSTKMLNTLNILNLGVFLGTDRDVRGVYSLMTDGSFVRDQGGAGIHKAL